ncbi:AraC family transcriptional regulator [Cohnella zeiphila]|uniref:Helix-turn-helix transcriptional regulator n=1 Tax=Cohnella zeiphila TaxID=2761120 RepID=A0A7X0VW64_9BACL|nr:AraC family transcriptional regulator [Cohnella zeiphila]MBB6730628.1 helix-turn-helix transcriptional regulator [Cohnella zeiphila]
MSGKMDFFYYRSHESGSYVDFHRHSCYELVYYVTGTGTMQLDGRRLSYRPGTLTLTRPLYPHDERHDEYTEVIFFGFVYDDHPVALPNGLYRDSANGEILGLMYKIKQELLERQLYHENRVNLMMNEIILLLGRSAHAGSPVRQPEKLLYARRYMDENFVQPLHIRTLAEISGYSEDHFRHLFKEQTGLSPAQYVIRKRLEAAKEKLLSTSASISEIGQDSGFSTTSQFIELFKREWGATPLQFRRQAGGGPP